MSHPDLAGRPHVRNPGATTLKETGSGAQLLEMELRPALFWFARRSSGTIEQFFDLSERSDRATEAKNVVHPWA